MIPVLETGKKRGTAKLKSSEHRSSQAATSEVLRLEPGAFSKALRTESFQRSLCRSYLWHHPQEAKQIARALAQKYNLRILKTRLRANKPVKQLMSVANASVNSKWRQASFQLGRSHCVLSVRACQKNARALNSSNSTCIGPSKHQMFCCTNRTCRHHGMTVCQNHVHHQHFISSSSALHQLFIGCWHCKSTPFPRPWCTCIKGAALTKDLALERCFVAVPLPIWWQRRHTELVGTQRIKMIKVICGLNMFELSKMCKICKSN